MTTQYIKLNAPKILMNQNTSKSVPTVNVENAHQMKTTNDQITTEDFKLMEQALNATIEKCSRALFYGEDMKSSRLLLLRDAKVILDSVLFRIKSNDLQYR